ncbi:hypothetical protein JHN52_01165 [Streptomyces sp. MBT97]|uniref:hypothetical protein n=1 Tax=Streptomyces sp. MBT97 TaxID=2800411 RepID=UPI00190C6FED|nr:hypothetical protein [Streptomyces sp. MBT97]MBK3631590.1 hypothetical protein [Streptomyces sp. MBT97]
MTPRLEVLGKDGEWHEVPGIVSVELRQEELETQPDDAYWRRHDALDALHFAMTARAEAARPRVIDQEGRPVLPRQDRPPWHSPYGPPPRRH